MHRSGVDELCRLAEDLFDALREEFAVDTETSVPPSNLLDCGHLGQRELVMIGMHGAGLIHTLGHTSARIDYDETIAVLNVLDIVLRRLLRDRRNGSRAVVELRRIHRKVADIGLMITAAEALDDSDPDGQ
jgi:hypothetical protein